MTRKDYVQIAQVFALHMQVANEMGAGDQQEVIEDLAGDMAHMLHRDNPRFDRDKFLVACGVK
jgi:hypothetical protein